MYTAFLVIHSYLRWLVLLMGVVVLVRAIGGLSRRRPWQPADDSAGRLFTLTLDIQLLVGIVIYLFLSPFTMPAWDNVAETMRNAPLRLIAVEHPVGMLAALALAHIGRARIRTRSDPAQRHRTALVFYGLSTIVILLSIPWPFMEGGRALFRGFGV